MTVVLAVTPVTVPVLPIVAMAVLLLLQLPPVVASVRVIVVPADTVSVPPIVAGIGLTVTTAVVDPAPMNV